MILDLAVIVHRVALEELPNLIGQLEAAKAAAWARLTAPTPSTHGNGHGSVEQATTWIKASEAAGIANVEVKRIYEWARGQRWASRPTKRCLRINVAGFSHWLSTR